MNTPKMPGMSDHMEFQRIPANGDTEKCPHCYATLVIAKDHVTGIDVPACPECAYLYDSDEPPNDDAETLSPIEREMEGSR